MSDEKTENWELLPSDPKAAKEKLNAKLDEWEAEDEAKRNKKRKTKTPSEKAVDQDTPNFNPAKLLSNDTKAAVAEETDKRKSRTVAETFIPEKNQGWKRQERLWADASDDDRKGMLYDMVLRRGYVMGRRNTLQRIARYFSVKQEEITKDEYLRIMWMADEARVSMIDENVLAGFLIGDRDASGKYHIQNTYAYKVQNPAWEGVDAVNQAPTQIIYNEIKGENTELRAELEALVQKKNAEIDKKKLTVVK